MSHIRGDGCCNAVFILFRDLCPNRVEKGPPIFDQIASPRRNASLLYLPGPSGPAFFSAGQRMVILVLEVILEEVIEKD